MIRLEDGEIIHEQLEQFAAEKSIRCAYLIALGGIDQGSKLVCGPETGRAATIIPQLVDIIGVHEVTGTGTIFPDGGGRPSLHMHLACGRDKTTVTGCIRPGVKIWQVLEVVLVELIDCAAQRLPDRATGFNLLEPYAEKR
ncbi:MAG: DNA-binding protein [Victivallaceae bacterium]|nr:DNA-binding protein [Victivallaceae bacterium]